MHEQESERDLGFALIVTTSIFLLELIGGVVSNSLALISDSVHMLGDAVSLLLSYLAIRVARRPPSLSKTFGYHRLEVLAALANGTTLTLISMAIFYKAYQRLVAPPEVHITTMLGVALVGLIANTISATRLHHHAGEDLNVRSAFLHVMGDAFASLAVITGGVVILFTGNYIVDPILSFLIGGIILLGSLRVIRESLHILLEGTPEHIDLEEVKKDIMGIEGVVEVHDLHAWAICSHINLASAHVGVQDRKMSDVDKINETINQKLKEHSINHITLQFECQGSECPSELKE